MTAPDPPPARDRAADPNPSATAGTDTGTGTGRVRRPATEAEARVLASAVRLRIIRLCLGETLTNKEIAERLGRDPASVLHHVRRLVETGFLQPLPLRRGNRGAKEIPYRSTDKSWTLRIEDPVEHRRTNDAMLQAFLDELADARGEVATLTRLGLRLRPDERTELHRRIAEVLEEFISRTAYDADDADGPEESAESGESDGEWWSVFIAIHRDHRGAPPDS